MSTGSQAKRTTGAIIGIKAMRRACAAWAVGIAVYVALRCLNGAVAGPAFPSYSMRYKRILAYPGRFRKESWHPWNWKMLAEVAGAIP